MFKRGGGNISNGRGRLKSRLWPHSYCFQRNWTLILFIETLRRITGTWVDALFPCLFLCVNLQGTDGQAADALGWFLHCAFWESRPRRDLEIEIQRRRREEEEGGEERGGKKKRGFKRERCYARLSTKHGCAEESHPSVARTALSVHSLSPEERQWTRQIRRSVAFI